MEAFEERLNNPTNYYIFYNYFLRALVGEKVWKQATGAQEKELRNKGDCQGLQTIQTRVCLVHVLNGVIMS
jgi:hypothetical protein